MKKRYKRMIDTRKVYQLETDMYHDRRFAHITKQRSLDYLIRYAKKIWKGERCKKELPHIRFGKGAQRYSWCDGETIELASSQRDILTLVHEMVHAVGHLDHDKNFAAKELVLFKKYTPIQAATLNELFKIMLMD